MKQITISGDDRASLIADLKFWLGVLDDAQSNDVNDEGEGEAEAPKTRRGRRSKATSKKAPKITRDAFRKIVTAAIDEHGEDAVRDIFKKHKAKKLSDFKETSFEAVIADVNALAGSDDGDDDDDDGIDLD